MGFRAVYRIFAKGGRTRSMSKRVGARLFVAAGQPQGGVGIQGGARITQGGANALHPPKYTPVLHVELFCIRIYNDIIHMSFSALNNLIIVTVVVPRVRVCVCS